jgi:hypothetical protein
MAPIHYTVIPRHRRRSSRYGRTRPCSGPGPRPHHHQGDARRNTVIAYHGTPSQDNAKSILQHGWMVGSGNALGDGIYLSTSLSQAKGYARSTGVYIKCMVTLGKTCQWDSAMQARYAEWCRQRGAHQNNSAITAYLLQHRYDTVQRDTILVILAPQYTNPAAWKLKHRQIKILSIHRAADDARIRL